MHAKGTLFARLALASLCALLGVALAAVPAQAGCEICDQYTLDIPEPPSSGGGGSSDGGGGDTSVPESTPAPAPAPVAPVEAAPVAPVEPATTDSGPEPDRDKPKDKPKPKPEPAPDPLLLKTVDASGGSLPPASTPLEYDSSESTPEAALAGLGSPGTVALIVVLFAAGAATAIGRRRSSTSA